MILPPRIVKNLAAIAVSLLFLGWLFGHQAMSWAGIYEPLLALPAAVWLLVVIGLLSTYVLRGWRVAYEFRDYEKLTLLRAIQVVMWHNATLNVLPFRSGEVVFPLLLRQVADIPVVNSVTSLVYLRFLARFGVVAEKKIGFMARGFGAWQPTCGPELVAHHQ